MAQTRDTGSERSERTTAIAVPEPHSATISPAKAIGRVVVELGTDNRIYLERYINGQRQRVLLDRGNEWWEVLDALTDAKRRHQSELDRKQEAEAKATRQMHNRVWVKAAENHGAGFAHRVIKGDVPPGYGRYLLPEDRPKAKAKTRSESGSSVDLMDLL
jgi:hypothetical protein